MAAGDGPDHGADVGEGAKHGEVQRARERCQAGEWGQRQGTGKTKGEALELRKCDGGSRWISLSTAAGCSPRLASAIGSHGEAQKGGGLGQREGGQSSDGVG